MRYSLDKTKVAIALVFFAIGALCGFFFGKGIYQPTYGEKVARDTVIVHDTIPQYYPQPVEVIKTKVDYKWLTRVRTNTDTLTLHDSVLVEVPITSKHYQSTEYDAWVSGYEPSLDSIKVYKETQYITEVRTISKPPNKWELDIVGGINYNFNKKKYTPHVGGELLYKPNRLQVGIRGGVIRNDNFEPFVGAVAKYRIL